MVFQKYNKFRVLLETKEILIVFLETFLSQKFFKMIPMDKESSAGPLISFCADISLQFFSRLKRYETFFRDLLKSVVLQNASHG